MFDAGVCAPVAASNEGLEVLAEDIGDNASAVTRFVLVARPGTLPEPTGADKTTVVLFQRDDHAGGLLELLEQFAVRGVNMTRLESRPTGAAMGSYCFSIDFEGHVLDARVGETLMGLRRVCAEVRFLGSYPRADGGRPDARPGTSDADFDRRADLARGPARLRAQSVARSADRRAHLEQEERLLADDTVVTDAVGLLEALDDLLGLRSEAAVDGDGAAGGPQGPLESHDARRPSTRPRASRRRACAR